MTIHEWCIKYNARIFIGGNKPTICFLNGIEPDQKIKASVELFNSWCEDYLTKKR